MSQALKHYAQLAAGSGAEAVMNDGAAVGANGLFFNVAQGQVVRIPELVLNSEQAGGQARFRIRRDATLPTGAAPVLAVTDEIMIEVNIPNGAQNSQDLSGQPLELPGGANAAGTDYYMTIQQAGGAGFASALLNGRTT